jgi:hypothetical protein
LLQLEEVGVPRRRELFCVRKFGNMFGLLGVMEQMEEAGDERLKDETDDTDE